MGTASNTLPQTEACHRVIDVPPLRERAADIPLLVEYFIDRFGKKAGKKFRTIDNLCDGETFFVDETWLRRELPVARSRPSTLNRALGRHEKEMIETALAESYGQVSGLSGAATKLGLPARTLDSKIKRFKINKYRFKVPRAS